MTIKFTRLDLDYILTQIQMAEAGQPPINPLLSFGLREVAGTHNNGVPGQSLFGSSGQVFPSLTDQLFQSAQSIAPGQPVTSYAQTTGLVVDAQPRLISQLVASQTTANPAAMAAQADAFSQLGAGYQNLILPGADGIYGTPDDTGTTLSAGTDGILGTADDVVSFGNTATPTNASSSGSTIAGLAQSLFIPNITPDAGLSAPANSFFTFFGQFFDHGLDKIATGGDGQIYIPLMPDDPLYVVGGHANFMVETRATNQAGPDGKVGTADDVRQYTNGDSPFVDQSQTYGSDPSHQAFLREYMIGADGRLHSTGALLRHVTADGHDSMATWGDLKDNAAKFLGIKITDADVGNVPLLATDAYGNLILGATGLAQLVLSDGTLVTGTKTINPNGTWTVSPVSTNNAAHVGNAFINDMAHNASPTNDSGVAIAADSDIVAGNAVPVDPKTGNNLAYDNELLDLHYVAGDGRVNENIGLTAVQDLFHSEHDRLLAQTKTLIQSQLDAGDISYATNWVLPGVVLTAGHVIALNEWNGERLFQAAKFGTETEYQHIVFDEFARYVAPAIHLAGGVNIHIDPAITSEFANVVYRFGHSMLDENINIYVMGADGKPVMDANGQPQMTREGLIQAFTNPMLFANNVPGGIAKNATADIVLGTVNQISAEIDEFVTGSLQNNLLGLPLDLPALNIARGRDTGVAPLNLVRAQLYSQTGDSQLKPYGSWADFGSQIKHIESLVNFIAAYGTHSSVTSATTMLAKRAAAQALVDNGALGSATFSVDAYNFLNSQGAYANNKLDTRAIHDSTGAAATWSTGSITGLDNVDLWIGGLAEKQSLFGGVLGSTFEFVFRTQLEALQDGDRLYYLPRIEGTSYEDSLQDSSLAQLIRANTDIKHLPGNMFLTPEYTIEASTYFNADGSVKDPGNAANTWLHNPLTGKLLVNATVGGNLQFIGDDNFLGNTIVLGGTEGNDTLTAGAADDDTIWGDGGNDTVDAGGGNDFLFGGLGDDTVIGGQGDDVIHGDEGNDTIYGGDGVDTIFGGDGNDYILAGRGDDSVTGGLGDDIIIGNEGFDALVGDEGDDWMESKGGQGQEMFGDSGAPTGQTPLYSANDVLIGGIAGGDIMKGFNGDDIMLGRGSFTKFVGGLGYDWASYEQATHGIDADLNRKELVAANGTEDSIRDIYQSTEGLSGSASDDILKGTNTTRLLATKDELDNPNLIIGLQSTGPGRGFFDPSVTTFDAGNIILGGAGSDTIIGGGGDDIMDGDAFLHVGLAQGYIAGSQIIRQIMFDANGNTWDPDLGTGNHHAGNVDTAVFNDVFSDYDINLFGKDAEGFITIDHARAGTAIVGGNPQGLLGGDDGTDRIRNIERLQFSDITISIDSDGRILTSSDGRFLDAVFGAGSNPDYDAVPVGTPSITETDPNGAGVDPTVLAEVGDTLHATVALITDADGISTPITLQWQVQDFLSGVWLPIVGATGTDFKITKFQDGNPLRVMASYTDAKGVKEAVFSAPTILVTLPGNVNTPPFVVPQQQLNGIPSTTAQFNQPFDYFVPLTTIFNDGQTAPVNLVYTATLADGSSLASANLSFTYTPDPVALTGFGEFKTIVGGLNTTGQIGIRVTATDTGPGLPLSVTNTFFINVVPPNAAPVAVNDTYVTLENAGLTALTSTGVLHNDSDPNGDAFTAAKVTGPANGTLTFNSNGTFVYIPNLNFFGTDSFTYQDTDIGGAVSNVATATIGVLPIGVVNVAPTAPATTTALTASFVFGGASSGTTFSWDSSPDGVTWTLGVATTALYAPPVTGAPGIYLRSSATYTDLATNIVKTVTSAPVHYILDGAAADTLLGVAGANIIFGAAGDDVITAGTGPMLAYGGDGNDTFKATVGDGSSTYDGQAGINTYDLSATSAAATVNLVLGTASSAQTGSDILAAIQNVIGGSGADTITVGATGGVFTGGAGNDTITGGAGNDSFIATVSDGNDTYTGGAGTDTYDLSAMTLAATVNLATLTAQLISTQAGTDTLSGIENLIGGAGADKLTGDANNNVITGGFGADTVVGGAGNDTFIATDGDGTDSYNGGAGVDTLDMSKVTTASAINLTAGTAVTAGVTDTLAGAIVVAGVTFNPIENAIGSAVAANTLTGDGSNNRLVGGAGADILDGKAGVDTMIGGAGGDTYFVDNTSDVVIENAADIGFDTVMANASYTLAAGVAVELLRVNGGVNTGLALTGNEFSHQIFGGAGNDTLTGGTGNDAIDGGGGVTSLGPNGGGVNTMAGGAGDDTYFVYNSADVVLENVGGGNDTVSAWSNYTLKAGVEVETLMANTHQTVNLQLIGNEFSHNIIGGAGTDTLTGGSGNDTLDGGVGADTLTGGLGIDKFVISFARTNSLAAAFDTITDFTAGTDLLAIGHTVTAANFFSTTFASSGNLINDLTSALTGANFKANGAAEVTITGNKQDAGTYAVINNNAAGYQSGADNVVKLLGAPVLTNNSFAA